MSTIKWIIATAPEIFLLLSVAIGTILGRVRFKGFALGSTACILIVAVILGQLGNFAIPPLFRSIFFSLFVFTIGYRSGPEFFAPSACEPCRKSAWRFASARPASSSCSASPFFSIWMPARRPDSPPAD